VKIVRGMSRLCNNTSEIKWYRNSSECRPLDQWFSTWGRDHQKGRDSFLEESRIDVLCTQLYYICFIRVLDGGRLVMVGCYNKSRYNRGWRSLL